MPTHMPTAEECERYWDAKMLSEHGIDACTLYGPEDYWWWQQLDELREQARKKNAMNTFAAISDPANSHVYSLAALRAAFAHVTTREADDKET